MSLAIDILLLVAWAIIGVLTLSLPRVSKLSYAVLWVVYLISCAVNVIQHCV